mmetsp:Transcript_41892/g.105304  ORF Transcript_41892/g.105304 Transcript_41892/m.105304 type:complete len:236 (-) Transcript_41892:113-820(-)
MKISAKFSLHVFEALLRLPQLPQFSRLCLQALPESPVACPELGHLDGQPSTSDYQVRVCQHEQATNEEQRPAEAPNNAKRWEDVHTKADEEDDHGQTIHCVVDRAQPRTCAGITSDRWWRRIETKGRGQVSKSGCNIIRETALAAASAAAAAAAFGPTNLHVFFLNRQPLMGQILGLRDKAPHPKPEDSQPISKRRQTNLLPLLRPALRILLIQQAEASCAAGEDHFPGRQHCHR